MKRIIILRPLLCLMPLMLQAASADGVTSWIRSQGGNLEQDSNGQIVSVDLTSTWVTDADMTRLSGLLELRQLNLSQTKITDAGLERLRHLRQVTELNLYYAEYISDRGIAQIEEWKKLERLILRGAKVTSRVFDHISGLTSLRTLDIAFTEVTDAGFEELANLTHLEELAVGGNRILGPALSLLKLLPALRRLDVGGIQRVDSGLWGIALNDANMQKLGELRKLKVLKLNGANIADRGLDRPGHKLARRQKLTSLSKLAGLTNLEALELNRTPLTKPGLEALRQLPQLRRLSLEYAGGVDDQAIPALLALDHLESLHLAGTGVTDEGLQRIGSLKHLKDLRVGGTEVTRKGVERFRQAHADCHVSWWKSLPSPGPTPDKNAAEAQR